MPKYTKLLTVLGLAFTMFSFQTPAQRIMLDASAEPKGTKSYQTHWDPIEQRLICFRDVDDSTLPAAQVVWSNGSKVSLYPLKDLPGANYIDIWDATASPNGEVVIAAILGYGPRNSRPIPVKSLLLTYDAGGTLRKVWDVDPYHHHHLAVDSSGNVYALGDGPDPKSDFPLLIKYSPSGKVLGEYLTSGLFEKRDDVVGSNSPSGESEIFVSGNHIFVWIAMTLELFDFSLDGTLHSKSSLSPAVRSVSDSTGATRLRFLTITTDSAQRIIAQVQLWPKDGKSSANVGLARFESNGVFQSWIEPVASGDIHRFIGLRNDDRPVFLERTGQKAVMIDLGK